MNIWHSNLPKTPSYFAALCGILSLFFILLVCFLIGNSVVSWPGVTVKLPHMKVVEINAADKLIVTITGAGDIFFNGRRMTMEQLEVDWSERVHANKIMQEKMKQGRGVTRYPTIVLCADKSVTLDIYSRVIDLARSLGMEVVLAADSSSGNGGVSRPFEVQK